jgi:hypothetical protein
MCYQPSSATSPAGSWVNKARRMHVAVGQEVGGATLLRHLQ